MAALLIWKHRRKTDLEPQTAPAAPAVPHKHPLHAGRPSPSGSVSSAASRDSGYGSSGSVRKAWNAKVRSHGDRHDDQYFFSRHGIEELWRRISKRETKGQATGKADHEGPIGLGVSDGLIQEITPVGGQGRVWKLGTVRRKRESKTKEEANEDGEIMAKDEQKADSEPTVDHGSSWPSPATAVIDRPQMKVTERPPPSIQTVSSNAELTKDDSEITDSSYVSSIDGSYASSNDGTWSLASLSCALESPSVATCTILTQYQARLVDNLMSEFHTLTNSGGIIARSRAPSEGSSSNSRGDASSGRSRTQDDSGTTSSGAGSGSRKRSRDQDKGNGQSEEDQDDEGGEPPKMLRISSPSPSTTPLRKLACPYFRQNPAKHVKYRSCAGPGKHVYRHHSVSIRCARCGETFESDTDLEQHYRQPERCEVRAEDVLQPDGLTKEQEKLLRKRKKLVSEEEKWRDMYRILFPAAVNEDGDDGNVPSPYYDDAPAQFADEFERYEQYLHRELPQLVRRRLEEAVSGFTTPLENQLRAQLVDIVRNSQSELFRSYPGRSATIGGSMQGRGSHLELPGSSFMLPQQQQSPSLHGASGSAHHDLLSAGGDKFDAQHSDEATAASLREFGHVSLNHFADSSSLVDFSAYDEPPALNDEQLLPTFSSTEVSAWAAAQQTNNTTASALNVTGGYSVFSDSGYGSNMNGEFAQFSGCYDDSGTEGKGKGVLRS